MAGSPKLVAFVVDLVVDAGTRERFHGGDADTREQMMSDAGLNDEERAAIRDGNSAALNKMMNIQIVIPTIRKAPARKPTRKAPRTPKTPTRKAPKTPKKKAPTKGGRAKGRNAAKKR